jgi:hypothetical protein
LSSKTPLSPSGSPDTTLRWQSTASTSLTGTYAPRLHAVDSPNQKPIHFRQGIATVSTITTGTAQSDQSGQTTAAPSSQASRTLSRPSRSPSLLPPLQQQAQVRPQAQHPAPLFPARAIPSPPTRASSSRSATAASPQAVPRPPLAHHHRLCRPREEEALVVLPPLAQACLLMRSPNWCTVSSSRCGIWLSVYQAGTSPHPFPFPIPVVRFEAIESIIVSHVFPTRRVRRAHGAGMSHLSATARRLTSCIFSRRSRATASSC